MKLSEIVVAFNTAFSSFPDLTAKHGLLGTKEFDGEPLATDSYMMCHLLNPDFQALDIATDGSYEVLRGIFQIDIYVPNGSGIYQTSIIGESLKSYFNRGTQIINGTTKINIERVVLNTAGIRDGAHTNYPVSVYYNVLS